MQRFSFDQYEFDSMSSEEALELAISSVVQHPTLTEFLTECGASSRTGSLPPVNWPNWEWLVRTVRTRTGLELPPIEECEVHLLSEEWNDVELAIRMDSVLLWYHWWTTA